MILNIKKWFNKYNSNLYSGELSIIVCSCTSCDYTPHARLLFICQAFKFWSKLLFPCLPLASSFFGWTLLFFSRAWFSYLSPSCVATFGNQLQFFNIFHESVVFQIEPKSLSVWAPECRVAVMSLESDFTYVNEAIDHTVSFLFLKPIIIDCSVGSWNQMSSPIEIFHLDSLSQVSYCYIQ